MVRKDAAQSLLGEQDSTPIPVRELTTQRGSATGLHHSKDTLWRQSQRERLHFFAHNASGGAVDVLVDRAGAGGVAVGEEGGQGGERGVRVDQWRVREMNERWLDVGLSGKPVQVSVGWACKHASRVTVVAKRGDGSLVCVSRHEIGSGG
jgi:hypothetical protein